jgi:hypothetical protein
MQEACAGYIPVQHVDKLYTGQKKISAEAYQPAWYCINFGLVLCKHVTSWPVALRGAWNWSS